MASVIGLAPIRVCLKGRLRGLLCIHGRPRRLAPGVGIAPTSPALPDQFRPPEGRLRAASVGRPPR
jgi:hypothetical protein